jgi:hypothetical protein
VKRLRVHVVPFVEDEILRQVLYIAQGSIDNALAWENRLRAAWEGSRRHAARERTRCAVDRHGAPQGTGLDDGADSAPSKGRRLRATLSEILVTGHAG